MMRSALAALLVLLSLASGALAQTEKFSAFPNATVPPGVDDTVVGLQGGANVKFPANAVGPLAYVTGNVAYYVNPSSVSTSPCGVSGGSTCQPGSDSNSCTSISVPCKTFQHAIYLATQTNIWGIYIGTAQIFLADGCCAEVVDFPGTIGLPINLSGAFQGASGIELIGNDATPANVTISAPDGSCTHGGTFGSAVLNFQNPQTYYIHGFGVSAVNEATDHCNLFNITNGVSVYNTGTINLGPAANGGAMFTFNGGLFDTLFETLNITAGDSSTGALDLLYGGGSFVRDGATFNFVGTNNFNGTGAFVEPAVDYINGAGFLGTPQNVTITGTVSGVCYIMVGSGAYMESGVPIYQAPYPGCTPVFNQAYFVGGLQAGAGIGGYMAFFSVTQNNQGSPSTTASSGCSVDAASGENTGELTMTSGTTSCSIVFAQNGSNGGYLGKPICKAWVVLTGIGVPAVQDQSSAPFSSFTITYSAGATTLIDYQCWNRS